MWRRVLPKTVVGQLMTILVVVLSLAQFMNLLLLVGEQRLQAQSKTYNEAIEYSATLLSRLPENLPSELPLVIRTYPGEPQGAFFISKTNRALVRKDAKALPRYNARFRALLKDQPLIPIQSFVTFLSHPPNAGKDASVGNGSSPSRDLYRPQRTDDDARGGQRRRPPPPRRPRNTGDGGNDLFRPSGPPPVANGPADRQKEIRISAEIRPGIWFNAMMPHRQTESLTGRILLATSLLLGLTILAGWLFAKRISRPLTNLTQAAERLGRGDAPENLEEAGPEDIRRAASAFNIMQTRLTRTLETQRTMLRAVGHDLRTPLTSLRLRAENIPDDLGKDKFIASIDDMTLMTEEILSWAKDASGTEDLASVDLEAMLASVAHDYQDQGRNVTLIDFKTVTVRIRRMAIKRALQNLINNALDYGYKAQISVKHDGNRIFIRVDDDGPGVPEAQLLEMVKPFIRLETSRNKATGGTGLGLSIAESIAQSHGGELILQNKKPTGLRASLSLPL